ncbi:eukaryotic translation initiation factor 2 subunit alpha [Pisolithus sp. B1]|nr:eukaryotic translation initiation factor 2 subunit alpha [Pisolithus sp. B1]
MRYYEQRYPEVDELVMVQVRQIAEMGAYVKLLEYDNIEGMILLSELSRRRIRSIQKLIRVGRNEVVVVLRVDREKGYIDLSKRRVSPEDIVKCDERYTKSKTVASIMRHVASKLPAAAAEEGADAGSSEEAALEKLYDEIAWPLGRTYGHPYDAFKLMLSDAEAILATLPARPSEEIVQILLATIARRLTPQPINTEAVPIKAKLVAPPLYVLSTNATDKYAAVERLERAIESIQASIESQSGGLVVKMKPKAVSETEEQDLAQLMAKAGQENAEVSGDEDEEEAT